MTDPIFALSEAAKSAGRIADDADNRRDPATPVLIEQARTAYWAFTTAVPVSIEGAMLKLQDALAEHRAELGNDAGAAMLRRIRSALRQGGCDVARVVRADAIAYGERYRDVAPNAAEHVATVEVFACRPRLAV